MHPEPPHKEPYKKPEITTFEGRRVGKDKEQQTRKYDVSTRIIYVRQGVTKKELAIIKLLQENKIPVEEPFEHTPKGDNKQMAYFGAEIELYKLVPKLSPEQKAHIIAQLVDYVSKMHLLGVSHNHLHGGNIVVNENGKLAFIDFKLVEHNPKIPWNDPKQVFGIFHSDLIVLQKLLMPRFGLDQKQALKVTFAIIDHYPMSWLNKYRLKKALSK